MTDCEPSKSPTRIGAKARIHSGDCGYHVEITLRTVATLPEPTDRTPYDTGSILRFITRRWKLAPLPGVIERDRALIANGGVAMGDLTAALDFGPMP